MRQTPPSYKCVQHRLVWRTWCPTPPGVVKVASNSCWRRFGWCGLPRKLRPTRVGEDCVRRRHGVKNFAHANSKAKKIPPRAAREKQSRGKLRNKQRDPFNNQSLAKKRNINPAGKLRIQHRLVYESYVQHLASLIQRTAGNARASRKGRLKRKA